MAEIDLITLGVVDAGITSIVGEMNHAIFRTGYSVVIRESWDATCGMLTADGRLVGMYVTHPVHLGAFEPCVVAVLKQYPPDEINEGDVFIINHPYEGGACHATDVIAITPVFVEGELIAWVTCLAHKTDLGGLVPGTNSTAAREVFHEGLLIPAIKLHSRRQPNEDIYRFICANSRTPELVRGDLRGQVGTNYIGERGVKRLCQRFGKDVVKTCFDKIIDSTERRFRAEISKWPDGTHEATNYLDPGFGRDRIMIHAAVTKKGDDILFDLTGTDDQVEGSINTRPCGARSAAWFGCIAFVDPTLAPNHGLMKAVRVRFRSGSLLDGIYPAACNTYTVPIQALADAITLALSKFVPEKAVAATGSAMTTISLSSKAGARNYILYDMFGSAYGGRPMKDGESAIWPDIANCRLAPVEMTETEFPLRCRTTGLAVGSGGAGQFRGGLALVREYRCLGKTKFSLRADHHTLASWGIAGGGPGKPGSCRLNANTPGEALLGSRVTDRLLEPGETVRCESPGGGGYGNPLEREPNKVLEDVLDGYISLESAREDYGVVIAGSPRELDRQATEQLRQKKGSLVGAGLDKQFGWKEGMASEARSPK